MFDLSVKMVVADIGVVLASGAGGYNFDALRDYLGTVRRLQCQIDQQVRNTLLFYCMPLYKANANILVFTVWAKLTSC